MEINFEIIVAFLAVVMSVWSLLHQRQHDKLTYKPIPVVIKYNYNDRVLVRLWNKGNGPMFIKSFQAGNKDSLIALMPLETRKLTYMEFVDTLPDRIIVPGDSLNLLEFKVRTDDQRYTPEKYMETLNVIKRTLHGVEVHLRYANIYKDVMLYESKKLNFGNLVDESKSIDEIKHTHQTKSDIDSEISQKQNQVKTWVKNLQKRI